MRRGAALLTILLGGCGGLLGAPSREEVAWAASPDGRVHAILSETNGGATTSFGYVVELHPADHRREAPVEAGNLYGAIRSSCAYGVDLHWIDATTLALRFDDAKQARVPSSVKVGGRRIRVVAHRGVVNASAPCGGMAAQHTRHRDP